MAETAETSETRGFRHWLFSISPFNRVILGLALGIFTGLFFGDTAGRLDIWGDAYIRLLQMTVLPYILVSLVGGLGRLDAAIARRIGLMGGALILLIWGITLASNLFLSLAYPDWTTASFFSTSLIESGKPFDPLQLYVPANPFYSMANTIVPAVVVFSILLGIALITVPDKAYLLSSLNALSTALMRIASFVGKLAPLGIFAIAAAAAGTLRVEELTRLQVYLWTYLLTWTVITFWTLPALVAWATPLSYRDVLREARLPMITAFATGTVLVVLPMIAERCKQLLEEHRLKCRETDSVIDVMVPTAYSFPSAGTLLGLGFVMFAAWYSGSPLGMTDYPAFVGVGAFVAFGSMAVAIPFMLDFFSLPADLFQLYLLGSVVTSRFATGLAAMHGIVISLLCAFAVMGQLRVRTLLNIAATSIGIAAAAAIGLGVILIHAIDYEYLGDQRVVAKTLVKDRVDLIQIKNRSQLLPIDSSQPRIEAILARGTLRVAYLPDSLPFAYRNSEGDVVGYDIDLVQTLAGDLGLSLEIARMNWPEIVQSLEKGQIDLAVGGISISPRWATQAAFSDSYIDHTAGFVMPDSRRKQFADLETVQNLSGLRILVPDDPYYVDIASKTFPRAHIEVTTTPRKYFKSDPGNAVLLYSVEAGSAWTLIYPDFSVAVPEGLEIKAPVAFALPRGAPDFVAYINTWLALSHKDGLNKSLFSHWVLGQESGGRKPRWSIMRNVLGWGE